MPTALCWIYEILVHPEADHFIRHRFGQVIKLNHDVSIDSRTFTPLDDLKPIQATDSAASNMQHMAVVRDFRIP